MKNKGKELNIRKLEFKDQFNRTEAESCSADRLYFTGSLPKSSQFGADKRTYS